MKTSTGSAGPDPSSRTLTRVHQAASLPVEQVEEPTLRDGPVLTPRPPAQSAGRFSRTSTEESHLSSNRSSLEPPAPSGAVRAASCGFSSKSDRDTARETVGPDSHRDPEAWCSRTGTLQARTAESRRFRKGTLQARMAEAWCSRKGTLQARTAEAWCSRTGTLQAQIPSTASDGSAPSAFDPSLEYSTDNVLLFWQPRPIFRSGYLRRLLSTACHILARSSL